MGRHRRDGSVASRGRRWTQRAHRLELRAGARRHPGRLCRTPQPEQSAPGRDARRAGATWRLSTSRCRSRARKAAYDYERQYTSHGVVIAIDRERQLAYTVRWSGTEPGAAPELGALAVARANSWTEFRTALERWKMPAADFVYADVDGHVGSQRAGLIPVRPVGRGVSVSAGWTGEGDWRLWQSLDRQAHELDPAGGLVVAAPATGARRRRIDELLTGDDRGLERSIRIEHDVVSWNAPSAHAAARRAVGSDPEVESARAQLLQWNGEIAADSRDGAALRRLGERVVAPAGGRPRAGVARCRVRRPGGGPARCRRCSSRRTSGLTVTTAAARAARDALLIEALAQAVDDTRRWSGADTPDATWGRFNVASLHAPAGSHRPIAAPLQRWTICAARICGDDFLERAADGRSHARSGSPVRRRCRGLGSIAGDHRARVNPRRPTVHTSPISRRSGPEASTCRWHSQTMR